MGGLLPFAVFGLVIALVILAIFWSRWLEKKRRTDLQTTADELGLLFHPEGDEQLYLQVSPFALFNNGRSRKMTNLILGETDEVKIALFDFKYTTGSGKHQHTHHQSVVSLQSPELACPFFTMRPEGMFDKIGGVLGMQDIDFESHPEFSRMFVLKGEEQQVRAFFGPEILEFFEAQKGISVEARPGSLIFYRGSKRTKAIDLKDLLTQAYQVFGIMVDQKAD